jgi:rare lipoprotein A
MAFSAQATDPEAGHEETPMPSPVALTVPAPEEPEAPFSSFALPTPSSQPCPVQPNPLEPCTDTQEIERGRASWYGPGFHGKRTASGERFDMYALTAAHKTLPFGTHLRIRSLRNGNEVDVRVNDRGPFTPGKMIDLSRAAAEAIGLVDLGVKDVVISIVNPAEAASAKALLASTQPIQTTAKRSPPPNQTKPKSATGQSGTPHHSGAAEKTLTARIRCPAFTTPSTQYSQHLR